MACYGLLPNCNDTLYCEDQDESTKTKLCEKMNIIINSSEIVNALQKVQVMWYTFVGSKKLFNVCHSHLRGARCGDLGKTSFFNCCIPVCHTWRTSSSFEIAQWLGSIKFRTNIPVADFTNFLIHRKHIVGLTQAFSNSGTSATFASFFVALERCSETNKIIRNMYICGALDVIYKFLVAHEPK